ncbi:MULTISPECIES: HDOD domain-containing protein [Thiorhodovibrio]|uniref:HDOD domain-containing protein n=1 Tax=Thiorhodovibrio TaxID=61593 RepID=UPI00191466DE|nr:MULTISPECIES: HDOD domain-containing protein [Thiorhodovibrio]MBK5969178.1 histidine kinase [Thiorhodovibrio winogradskyi]WPL11167.1 HDOD domain protein [Thiorhodovibrio litoralis]
MTIQSIVKSTGKLLAIPRVVGEVMRLLDDPDSGQPQIAKTLAQDPALVAMLLRLANSAAFSPSRTVDSVDRALALLGREQVRRLVITGAVTGATDRLPPQQLLPLEFFWRHSAYCAVIGRLLAEETHRSLEGVVFLGGLLHDLGQLVLFSQAPEETQRAFLNSLSAPQALSPQTAEHEQLGFDHAELGGALAEHWGLPQALCDILRFHHDPCAAPESSANAVALVHVANTGAHLAELDSRDWGDAPPIDSCVWSRLGITSDVLLPVIEQAQYQVLSVEALHDPELAG